MENISFPKFLLMFLFATQGNVVEYNKEKIPLLRCNADKYNVGKADFKCLTCNSLFCKMMTLGGKIKLAKLPN